MGIVLLIAGLIYVNNEYLTARHGPVLLVANSTKANKIIEQTEPFLLDEVKRAQTTMKAILLKRVSEPSLYYSLNPAGMDPDVAAALPNRVKMLLDLAALPSRLVPPNSHCTILRRTGALCGTSLMATSELVLVRVTSGSEKGLEAWACTEQIVPAMMWP